MFYEMVADYQVEGAASNWKVRTVSTYEVWDATEFHVGCAGVGESECAVMGRCGEKVYVYISLKTMATTHIKFEQLQPTPPFFQISNQCILERETHIHALLMHRQGSNRKLSSCFLEV